MKKYFFIALLVFFAWQHWSSRSQFQPDGVLAAAMPEQRDIDNAKPFELNGYTITPLATFTLNGRVLSKTDYFFGREADLAPVDIAFGWGKMSDSAVLDKVSISQGNRWYTWHTDKPPIPLREIELSSANMHLVPADAIVKRAIQNVRAGQLVNLQGKLIKIAAPDGWRWQSSLTREDVGGGACELVYVESFSAK
ncbi:MAG TPA: hypothetical protein VLB90_07910 [Pseudomonadales bacterium]|nr:hypothetical protein [Pseudomonadales bacterium]